MHFYLHTAFIQLSCLTQAQMVELFQSSKQNISLHINNIFKEGELQKDSVVKDYLTTASDLIRTAKKYLILIDNYIDDTVLTLFTKRIPGVRDIQELLSRL